MRERCIIRGRVEESSGNGCLCRGPAGEPGGLRLWGILRVEGFEKGASLSAEALLGERRGGSFAGDLEGYGEEDSGDRHHSPWEPHWGTCKGACPTRNM